MGKKKSKKKVKTKKKTKKKKTVIYTKKLSTGETLEESQDRENPYVVGLNRGQVIRGFDVGLATMSKGEKSKFKCFPNYGYGHYGQPPKIPGKSIILLEIGKSFFFLFLIFTHFFFFLHFFFYIFFFTFFFLHFFFFTHFLIKCRSARFLCGTTRQRKNENERAVGISKKGKRRRKQRIHK